MRSPVAFPSALAEHGAAVEAFLSAAETVPEARWMLPARSPSTCPCRSRPSPVRSAENPRCATGCPGGRGSWRGAAIFPAFSSRSGSLWGPGPLVRRGPRKRRLPAVRPWRDCVRQTPGSSACAPRIREPRGGACATRTSGRSRRRLSSESSLSTPCTTRPSSLGPRRTLLQRDAILDRSRPDPVLRVPEGHWAPEREGHGSPRIEPVCRI